MNYFDLIERPVAIAWRRSDWSIVGRFVFLRVQCDLIDARKFVGAQFFMANRKPEMLFRTRCFNRHAVTAK